MLSNLVNKSSTINFLKVGKMTAPVNVADTDFGRHVEEVGDSAPGSPRFRSTAEEIHSSDYSTMGALLSSIDCALTELRMQVETMLSTNGIKPTAESPFSAQLGVIADQRMMLCEMGDCIVQFLSRVSTMTGKLGKLAKGFSAPMASPSASMRLLRRKGSSSLANAVVNPNFIFGEPNSQLSEKTSTVGIAAGIDSMGASLASLPAVEVPEVSKVSVSRDDEGNKRINEYVVIGDLGRGAFGKVKLAIKKDDDQQTVAIKVLNKSLLRKATNSGITGMEQVQTEIAVMKKLRHRNIVSLYEVIDDPTSNKLYLVMQYVERGPVIKLDESGHCEPLEEPKARDYTRQIAAGLMYLHRHNVVHRDIKPDNILLGNGDALYLSDFGVSRMLESDDDMEEARHEGTPAFFSPELCRGEGGVHGKAADVWALGVTLYCFLIGHLPFFATEVTELMHKIQNCSLELPPGIPPVWREILTKLLDKDPKQRMTLAELRNHTWLCGTPSSRQRRFSEYDVVTVEPADIHAAIAVGNDVRLNRWRRETPQEKVGNFVDKIREKVRVRSFAQPKPPVTRPKNHPRQVGFSDQVEIVSGEEVAMSSTFPFSHGVLPVEAFSKPPDPDDTTPPIGRSPPFSVAPASPEPPNERTDKGDNNNSNLEKER